MNLNEFLIFSMNFKIQKQIILVFCGKDGRERLKFKFGFYCEKARFGLIIGNNYWTDLDLQGSKFDDLATNRTISARSID